MGDSTYRPKGACGPPDGAFVVSLTVRRSLTPRPLHISGGQRMSEAVLGAVCGGGGGVHISQAKGGAWPSNSMCDGPLQ